MGCSLSPSTSYLVPAWPGPAGAECACGAGHARRPQGPAQGPLRCVAGGLPAAPPQQVGARGQVVGPQGRSSAWGFSGSGWGRPHRVHVSCRRQASQDPSLPALGLLPGDGDSGSLASQRFYHVLHVASSAGEHEKVVQVLQAALGWATWLGTGCGGGTRWSCSLEELAGQHGVEQLAGGPHPAEPG